MKRSPLLLALLVLAGCGGGGGTIAGPGGNMGGQNVSLGSIQAAVSSGSVKPLIIDGFTSSSAFYAMSGATFTRVAYTPAKTLNNTRIAFGRSAGNLWTADPSGGHLNQVTTTLDYGGAVTPSWSPDAFRIVFQAVRGSYGYFLVGATGFGLVRQ